MYETVLLNIQESKNKKRQRMKEYRIKKSLDKVEELSKWKQEHERKVKTIHENFDTQFFSSGY